MKPVPRRLWGALATAGALALVATWSLDGEDGDDAAGTVTGAASAPAGAHHQRAPADAARVELERLARVPHPADAAASTADRTDGETGNAFAAKTWEVAPPPPDPAPVPVAEVRAPAAAPAPAVVAEPPPPPRAPALPFTYLGRFEDGETRVVMLVKGDRIHTVAHGDVIEGLYRVDRIDEQQVELTYLPLDQKQSLAIGGTS